MPEPDLLFHEADPDHNDQKRSKVLLRCGDLKTAFNLVDEMKEQKFSIDSDVFNFIIQGCISDKVGEGHGRTTYLN